MNYILKAYMERKRCPIRFGCYYANTCVWTTCKLEKTRELRQYEITEPIDLNPYDYYLKAQKFKQFEGLTEETSYQKL